MSDQLAPTDSIRSQQQQQENQFIGDEPFDLSYMTYDENSYERFLQLKRDSICRQFQTFEGYLAENMEVIASPPKNFRNKCRFHVVHEENDRLAYAMWENGSPCLRIESFPLAATAIAQAMPLVRDICQDNIILRAGLSAAHFLCTNDGDLLITLIYDTPIDENIWKIAADDLRVQVRATATWPLRDLDVIGRSKGIKVVVEKSHVFEVLRLPGNREFRYKQVDDGFSNPNGFVNAKALDWICRAVELAKQQRNATLTDKPFDMLEMYCGNGNHTVALAGMVDRLLATELSPSLCKAAEFNLEINGVKNAVVVPCDSMIFANRVLKTKAYTVKSWPGTSESNVELSFGCVLVDPPRCGLDPNTCKLVTFYDFIVYISCNSDALHRDLLHICKTHVIEKFAIFDQFAYTPHVECGVLLRRKTLELES